MHVSYEQNQLYQQQQQQKQTTYTHKHTYTHPIQSEQFNKLRPKISKLKKNNKIKSNPLEF